MQNLAELEKELAQIEVAQEYTKPVPPSISPSGRMRLSETKRSETKEAIQLALEKLMVDKVEVKEGDDAKAFFSVVYALRERLNDSEVKTMSRAMRNISKFEDYIFISNSIIDSVIKDVRRRVLNKNVDKDMKNLVADLLIEVCKLRKMGNSYMEVINGPTVEKLGKFVDTYADSVGKDKKKSWQTFPLFNFFSGWEQNKRASSQK